MVHLQVIILDSQSVDVLSGYVQGAHLCVSKEAPAQSEGAIPRHQLSVLGWGTSQGAQQAADFE